METNLNSFLYDFERRTYDSTNYFKSLTGSPTVSSNQLRLNAMATVMLTDFVKGLFEFKTTVPVGPTVADSRKIGLYAGGKGAYAYFDITGTTFSIKCADGEGGTDSLTVAWDAAWTATGTRFKIVWGSDGFTFFVNDIKVGKLSGTGNSRVPMAPYLLNGNADNMDTAYILVVGAQTMFRPNA